VLIEALNNRKDRYVIQLGKLAYEKLNLQKRIEEIDNSIRQIEGAQIENEQATKDFATQEVINQSQKLKQEAM
jgi:hypothetical protein